MSGRRTSQSALGGAHTPRPATGPSEPVRCRVRVLRPPLPLRNSGIVLELQFAIATVTHPPDKGKARHCRCSERYGAERGRGHGSASVLHLACSIARRPTRASSIEATR
jgi:hypothetical protein